jgi:hypothetical protein
MNLRTILTTPAEGVTRVTVLSDRPPTDEERASVAAVLAEHAVAPDHVDTPDGYLTDDHSQDWSLVASVDVTAGTEGDIDLAPLQHQFAVASTPSSWTD